MNLDDEKYSKRTVAANGLRAVFTLFICMGLLLAAVVASGTLRDVIPDLLLVCLLAFIAGYATRDTEQ